MEGGFKERGLINYLLLKTESLLERGVDRGSSIIYLFGPVRKCPSCEGADSRLT